MPNSHVLATTPNFATVTEVAGEDITQDQLQRMCHRYRWAAKYCKGKDVLELACGCGQGLGYLAGLARSLQAGDILPSLVERAQSHYKGSINITVIDAMTLPLPTASVDVVILFEAIYYMPDAGRVLSEAYRVLRPDGVVLIATANKDTPDFSPSPFSHEYYGTVELHKLLQDNGFKCELTAAWQIGSDTMIQRMLIYAKKTVVALGLMPKTMSGKKWLKRIVFGTLERMPAEIDPNTFEFVPPVPTSPNQPDRHHRVIYGVGRK